LGSEGLKRLHGWREGSSTLDRQAENSIAEAVGGTSEICETGLNTLKWGRYREKEARWGHPFHSVRGALRLGADDPSSMLTKGVVRGSEIVS
jgi:hypothetical protein